MSRPTLVTLLLATAAAAVALLAGCATSTHAGADAAATTRATPATTTATVAPSAAQVTAVRTFVPFDTSGAPSRPASGRVSGSCWTQSLAARDAAAFRCMGHNQIFDPCFATSTTAKTVACYADPWTRPVLMHLTAALPAVEPGSPPVVSPPVVSPHSSPWALQLRNGARCVAATGTVQLVHGIAMSYLCGGKASTGLLGSITSGGLIRARYTPTGTTLRTVPVTVAWQG